ncbi:enoyl-CoA hydratase domain-containing protein 3, mitochondrial [Drosophila tropicalis]|uniref:enoyl-CoA hydratase domain-containing protein 3, mitochondrial n=1 Tax=Drosophila tropicalis TaxID=46794 RepID=UPI0035ABC83D
MLRNIANSYRISQRLASNAAASGSNNAKDYLLVKESDGVREITLNHPKTLNSLSLEMMSALHEAMLKNVNNINLRCVVLAANGKVWSAGHNLKELQANPEIKKDVFQKLTDIILDIRKLPVPVIAKVNGFAAAAGCQLAASCDIVVCTMSSKFSTPGAGVGIFCSTPGVAISRVMPRPKSAYMLMTGLPISGVDAYVAGLATKVVPEDELDKEIDEITQSIRIKSRAVISFGKKFYYEQLNMPVEEAYLQAGAKMCDNLEMTDCREGITSFIEKRKPTWKHED